jgi:hypothetical protein
VFYVILKNMFKRLSIHVALIFLFAFAQIGVVTHEISHVEDLVKHNQAKHSQQDANKPDPSKQHKSAHSEQCEQCISFAKIAGGLMTQSFEFAITQTSFIGNTQLSTQASSQPHTAYAARAPPHLT